jgi:hypothetical protein
MCSSQQTDQRIHELINRYMLDGLLLDLHPLADRAKEIQLLQFYSYGRQRSGWAKIARCQCDRLVHGDAPSHLRDLTAFMRSESSLFFVFGKPIFGDETFFANLGQT